MQTSKDAKGIQADVSDVLVKYCFEVPEDLIESKYYNRLTAQGWLWDCFKAAFGYTQGILKSCTIKNVEVWYNDIDEATMDKPRALEAIRTALEVFFGDYKSHEVIDTIKTKMWADSP